MPLKRMLYLLFFLFLTANLYSQKKDITYQQVYGFRGPSLTNPIGEIENWLDDAHYLVIKKVEGLESSPLVKVNAETGKEEIFLDYDKMSELNPDGTKLSKHTSNTDDYNTFYFEKGEDSFVYTMDKNELIKLPASELKRNNVTLSPDGNSIAFTSGRNLYVIDLVNMQEKQLTFDGGGLIMNGWSSWIYYEEILGRSTRYKAFWWSPDSKHLSFMKFDDSPVPEFLLYDASGPRGEWQTTRYPKVGDPNPIVNIGIADIQTGNLTWVDAGFDSDNYVAWPLWSKDSKYIYYQWVNRGWDNIRIYRSDITTGDKKKVYDEKQSTWVYFFDDIYFFENEPGFLVRSDRDGWRHLYHYNSDGELIEQVTSGEWHVKKIVRVDEANGRIFFEANHGGFLERHVYSINIDGSDLEQLTDIEGTHRSEVSPEGSYIIDTYSSISQPNRMDLMTGSGDFIRRLGDSYTTNLEEYNVGKIELLTIPTPDGLELPVKWVLPPDFDEDKKYPIIFSVYGGPGAGSIGNSWPRRNSSFYWANKGIIYANVDNRGCDHFSKDIMGQVHRNLGRVEIDDFITAGKYVSELPFIDKDKIGISGGSYGGYAALMALTRGADYFDVAIASASVTDWRLYDNVYTERFMDSYDENEEGYEFGSVMTHAEKLKGKLLVTHGTMDDNVHMQNTMQLVDKLTDLDKDFTLMLYPHTRHGFNYSKMKFMMRQSAGFWFRHLLDRELDVDKD